MAANKERQAAFDKTRFSNQWQHIFDAGWNAATKAAEARFTSTNTASDAIGLLLAVKFHINEIDFGCLQGLEADIRNYAVQRRTLP